MIFVTLFGVVLGAGVAALAARAFRDEFLVKLDSFHGSRFLLARRGERYELIRPWDVPAALLRYALAHPVPRLVPAPSGGKRYFPSMRRPAAAAPRG